MPDGGNMEKLVERFLTYVKFDTQSDSESQDFPSTTKQFDLLNFLNSELKSLGLVECQIDKFGYLTATLPANTDLPLPVIGLMSHVDTYDGFSGKNVSPRIIENYDGSDILLNKNGNIVLDTKRFPELLNYKGQSLIVTDGTTLLGADDKAGIAEIITAIEYLIAHPEIVHGKIRVSFSPDEEVGNGMSYFDAKAFGADFAYTIDGGEIGELEYENFNAAGARIGINGASVHTGSAKNKMKNALLISMEFQSLLPSDATPSLTENYEGFFHLERMFGNVERAEMFYIIRDHDMVKFIQKKELFTKAVNFMNEKHGDGTIELHLKDQYFNMLEKIKPTMHIVETAKSAMEELGITPIVKPIRGGTDGARLSYMGIPTPNIFTGGHNFHGKFEFIPIESMRKSVEVIVRIVAKYGEKGGALL